MQLLPLDAATYRRHPLHDGERTWTETNCYVDLWIELLHALGRDPVAGLAFTLSTDFEGDQWSFFKYPPDDLRLLYGIEVGEVNVWRPVVDHIAEQLAHGRLLTVEVDSWYLPDTAGVSYQLTHTKTTIVPQSLDREARRLGYFHNAGYFELAGDDFDGVLRLVDDPPPLVPYVELVRLERLRQDDPSLEEVLERVGDHLRRRPGDNPVTRFAKRVQEDVAWLADAGLDAFHDYAFGTCRQLGATAELAAELVRWLTVAGEADLDEVARRLRAVAEGAKGLQFTLARAARGRAVDLTAPLEEMATDWEHALGALASRYA